MKPQLCLLHFAGGNAYSFQFLLPLLDQFEVISLELPGRGRRIGESLLTNFDEAVQDVYHTLKKRLGNTDIILYGHSLGAYLAFGLAGLLEKDGRSLACLLVSGNAGPGVREATNKYQMSRHDFLQELKKLGGIPEAFLGDPELIDFFEPILRADFELAERNELATALPVQTPIFAMMGNLEEQVELLSNWGKFTRGRFEYAVMPGDHFFIHDNAQQIAGIIRSCWERRAQTGSTSLNHSTAINKMMLP